jgi:hypothetical protein
LLVAVYTKSAFFCPFMALASLLSALSLKPSSSDNSTPLLSYYFKPKSSDADLKLVVVVAEEDRDIGKASPLAKQLGLKDMRACDDAALKEFLGVSKAEGVSSLFSPPPLRCLRTGTLAGPPLLLFSTRECPSIVDFLQTEKKSDNAISSATACPLHLNSTSGPSTLVVLSTSLTSHSAVSIACAAESIVLDPSDLTTAMEKTGAKVTKVEFGSRTPQMYYAKLLSPNSRIYAEKNESSPVAKAQHDNTRPAQAPAQAQKAEIEGAAQLGITIKKDSSDFSGWYQQVRNNYKLIFYGVLTVLTPCQSSLRSC